MSTINTERDKSESIFYDFFSASILEPGLNSILAFDCVDGKLQQLAKQFESAIRIAMDIEDSLPTLILNSATNDEDIWGQYDMRPQTNRGNLLWQPSILLQGKPLLIVIPNLTRLSLVAVRACVTLLANDWATLQRYGIDWTWKPHFWCLAGCESKSLGEVSAHLLDRFALRGAPRESSLYRKNLSALERFRRFELEEDRVLFEFQFHKKDIDTFLQTRKCLRTSNLPVFIPEACDRVIEYFHESTEKCPQGMRRSLTLARLARAFTKLSGAKKVSVDQVDIAATLLGLKKPTSSSNIPSKPIQPGKITSPSTANQKTRTPSNANSLEQKAIKPDQKILSTETNVPREKQTSNKALQDDGLSIIEDSPYREDVVEIEHDLEPLRWPVGSPESSRLRLGNVIGTRPATDFEDISLHATIFEAAKNQRYRKNLNSYGLPSLSIQLSDLRCYRRSASSQYLLLCAIDFTCLEGRDWESALIPHLRDWAYINRASIGIVRIGAKDARNYLQAEFVQAKNLLSPKVESALEGEPGIATPLAHGLNLVVRAAQKALQQERNTKEKVRLIVLTDGRGNIPLLASLNNKLTSPMVNQEGIEDAVEIARKLASISRLEIVLLNPVPVLYSELPRMLAHELGAIEETVHLIPASSSI